MALSLTRSPSLVDSCEIKGTLSLTANDDSGSSVVASVNKGDMDGCALPFSINTHPKIDKKRWEAEGALAIKGGKVRACESRN